MKLTNIVLLQFCLVSIAHSSNGFFAGRCESAFLNSLNYQRLIYVARTPTIGELTQFDLQKLVSAQNGEPKEFNWLESYDVLSYNQVALGESTVTIQTVGTSPLEEVKVKKSNAYASVRPYFVLIGNSPGSIDRPRSPVKAKVIAHSILRQYSTSAQNEPAMLLVELEGGRRVALSNKRQFEALKDTFRVMIFEQTEASEYGEPGVALEYEVVAQNKTSRNLALRPIIQNEGKEKYLELRHGLRLVFKVIEKEVSSTALLKSKNGQWNVQKVTLIAEKAMVKRGSYNGILEYLARDSQGRVFKVKREGPGQSPLVLSI